MREEHILINRRRTIEQYQKLAKKYFAECDEANAACSEKAPLAKPYTLSGLLCALGIDRDGFKSLESTRNGRMFVRNVLTKIEAFIEENALSGRISAAAASNSLKYSFGWNDKDNKTAENGSISISLSDEAKKLGE